MSTLARYVLITSCLSGCLLGGGPVVGYGFRSNHAIVGVEASAGLPVLEATAGYEHELGDASGAPSSLMYLRGDTGLDDGPTVPPTDPALKFFGARIGGGIGWDGAGMRGVFAVGPSYSFLLVPRVFCGGGDSVTATVELQLRYAHGWAIALVPRIEEIAQRICLG